MKTVKTKGIALVAAFALCGLLATPVQAGMFDALGGMMGGDKSKKPDISANTDDNKSADKKEEKSANPLGALPGVGGLFGGGDTKADAEDTEDVLASILEKAMPAQRLITKGQILVISSRKAQELAELVAKESSGQIEKLGLSAQSVQGKKDLKEVQISIQNINSEIHLWKTEKVKNIRLLTSEAEDAGTGETDSIQEDSNKKIEENANSMKNSMLRDRKGRLAIMNGKLKDIEGIRDTAIATINQHLKKGDAEIHKLNMALLQFGYTVGETQTYMDRAQGRISETIKILNEVDDHASKQGSELLVQMVKQVGIIALQATRLNKLISQVSSDPIKAVKVLPKLKQTLTALYGLSKALKNYEKYHSISRESLEISEAALKDTNESLKRAGALSKETVAAVTKALKAVAKKNGTKKASTNSHNTNKLGLQLSSAHLIAERG